MLTSRVAVIVLVHVGSKSPPTPGKALLHATLPWRYEEEAATMPTFQSELRPLVEILRVLERF